MHQKPQIDVRKVTVIPRKQWNEIQSRLAVRPKEEESLLEKIAERKRLHEKSVAVVKNWPNTIEGQRMRKLEARKLRAEAEEKKMQIIDKEEAKFQQAKRKEAIDKAKTLQYYQTDRVKSFHAAMMLSEVLKERDAQVEMKKKMKELQLKRDEKLESYHDVEFKEAMEREEREKNAARELRRNVADYVKYFKKFDTSHQFIKFIFLRNFSIKNNRCFLNLKKFVMTWKTKFNLAMSYAKRTSHIDFL